MKKSTLFFIAALLFLGGVLTGSSFDIRILIGLAILVFILTVVSMGKKFLIAAVLFVLSFTIGILLVQNTQAERAVLKEFDNANFTVTLGGYISSDPFVIGASRYFDFRVKEILAPGYVISTLNTIRVSTALYPEYKFGETLELTGYLKNGRLNKPEIRDTDFGEPFYAVVYRIIFEAKKLFLESVNRSISEPSASFINGILLGERAAIPQNLKDAFQKTGMVHILAISGYNVTIVVSLIYALFLFFLKRSHAFWFAVVGISIFTVLTGASSSVVRAAIMGCLVLLAHREGRMYLSSHALIFAAALMVVFNPLVIWEDLGFLLSFAATVGILYAAPILEKYMRGISEFYGAKETAIATTAAQLTVLPLLLFSFGSFSPLALLVNILVLPLIPLAMLLGFATGLIGLVLPFFARIVGYLPWLVTTFQIEMIEFFGQFGMWSFSFNFPLLVAVYGLLLYWMIRSY